MSKYIIELNEDCKIVQQICATEHGNVYTESCYSFDLEELNSDYINEHYGKLQDEAYQRGLDDAMSAFKKLYSCGWERDWKAMGFEFDDGEWFRSFEYIIGQYTSAEIVEKVKAYEDKQKDRVDVGDEAIWTTDNTTLIVTSMYKAGDFEWCDGISQDGRAFHVLSENIRKTGKHYDITSILEAMQS